MRSDDTLLTVGMRVGRYEVQGELGAGGMGRVYRATDPELGRAVALKLVSGSAGGSEGPTRLLREAQALARLAHPNVVTIHDAGRHGDAVFMAMELVEGHRVDVWLKERPRTWQEILRVFVEVGRGLAAAHAVGLVHRDIKPSNFVIGADGRARVLDFGLARAALPSGEGPAVARSAEAAALESGASRPLLDVQLTRAGAIPGTPPYMAPEQLAGRECDARADQFSFCVSLYEALYGVRPFDSFYLEDLLRDSQEGRFAAGAKGHNVPTWLRGAIARGLAARPEARYASMEELLAALGRDPAPRRRRALWIGATLGFGLLGAIGIYRGSAGPSACRDPGAALAGVWDAPRKAALRSAFLATGRPHAAFTAGTVERALDAWAAEWTAMRADACKATGSGEQSVEAFDLRMACLGRQLDELRARVELFSHADAEVVDRAAAAARSFAPLASCADVAALRAQVPPPVDAATRSGVEELRRELAAGRALRASGRYAEGLARVEPLVARAAALGYRPLEAEALLLAAQLATATGDYPGAARRFRDATVAAEASRHDEVAARAWNGLLEVVGFRQGKLAEAREIERDARAKVERLGRSELLLGDLEVAWSAILAAQAKYDEALLHGQRALALRERSLRPDDPALADAHTNLGDIQQGRGEYAEAQARYERALALAEQAVGPDHPQIAVIASNLGSALREQGRNAEAARRYEQARVIAERALGAEHPTLATIRLNLGSIARAEGRLDDAATHYARALQIWQKVLGPEHANTGTAHFYLGSVALQRGRLDEAEEAFGRARARWTKALGPEHPSLSAALVGLGDVRLARAEPAAAAERYQAALGLLEKALGKQHPELASPLVGLGRVALAQKNPAAAVAPLERALALQRKTPGEPGDLAGNCFALARALRATGRDRARAEALAREAQGLYEKAGPGHASALGELERWRSEGR